MLSNLWWGWVFLMNLPVLALALVAVLVLLPESRSPERPALDPVGDRDLERWARGAHVRHGQGRSGRLGLGRRARRHPRRPRGPRRVRAVGAGPGRQSARRPASVREPGRSPGARSSPGLGIFAFFGVMFAAPQYFQGVLGTDAMGSGVRLLPLLGGMMVGAGGADRIAAKAGAKITVTLGFAILAGALVLATATTATSGYGLAATWTALGGLGAGLALATASSAALATITTTGPASRPRSCRPCRSSAPHCPPRSSAACSTPATRPPDPRPGCPRRRRTRCGTACSRASRSPTSSARPRCSPRCGPRSSPGWTSSPGCGGGGGRRRGADPAVPAGTRHPGRRAGHRTSRIES